MLRHWFDPYIETSANMNTTRFFANGAHERKAVCLKSGFRAYGRAAGAPPTDVSPYYDVIGFAIMSLCSQPFYLIFRSPSRVQHEGTG